MFRSNSDIGAIVCYHRIDEIPPEHQNFSNHLYTTPNELDEQISFLKQNFHIVDIDMFKTNNRYSRPITSLTFDDGYRDFIKNALPIFEKHDVPASVFITSNYIDRKNILWWFVIDDFLNNRKDFQLIWDGDKYKFFTELDYERKRYATDTISRLFLKLNDPDHLENLTSNLLMNLSDQSLSHNKIEMMSWNDVATLAKHPLITIGGHTVNHFLIEPLPSPMIRYEIEQNKRDLENVTNQKLRHFCYPYGTRNSFSERSRAVLSENGFEIALTTIPNRVHLQDNVLNLPRIMSMGMNNSDYLRFIIENV